MNIKFYNFFSQLLFLLFYLCSFGTQAQEAIANYLPAGSRLAMGYYYPSLSIASTPTDIELSLNYWIQELTHSAGMENVYSVLYEDITKMNQDFEDGKLDMIVAPPLLIATHFNKNLLADGIVGVDASNSLNHLSIIAKVEPGEVFNGYKGKRLLLPKNDLLAKIFLESTIIRQYKKPLHTVFSSIKTSAKNQRMVLNLFFGKADIAVIYENSLKVILELNPQLERKITRIAKLPLLATNFGYFHRDYPYKKQLKHGIHLFNNQPRGKQILQIFHTTNIRVCKVSYLEPFYTLYNEYLELKKNI